MKCLMSVVGWALTLCLCIIYGIPIALFTAAPFIPIDAYRGQSIAIPVTITCLLVACLILWVILLALAFLISWLCKRKNWDARGYYRGCCLLILLALTPLFLVDAPAPANDYTWNDIPSPRKDAEQSHNLLMSLQNIESLRNIDFEKNKDLYHLLGTFPDYTNLLAHSSVIESMWSDIEPARQIIEKLDGFDEIGNIVDVSVIRQEDMTKRSEAVGMPSITLRNLAQRYWLYASLKVAQGKAEEGVRPLVQLHSVCRKSLPFSKSLLHKMIWIAVAGGDIEAAYGIANSQNCSKEALRLLKDGFPPLTDTELSLRGAFMGAYLFQKEYIRLLPNAEFLDSFQQHFLWSPAQPPPRWSHALSKVVSIVAYRPNRTIHDIRRLFDSLIEGTLKHPMGISTAQDFVKSYSKEPDFRNTGGWLFVRSEAECGFTKAIPTVSKNKVFSDLLSIKLHDQLGEPIDIPDYFMGKKYIRDDKTGTLSSAGPDGKPGNR